MLESIEELQTTRNVFRHLLGFNVEPGHEIAALAEILTFCPQKNDPNSRVGVDSLNGRAEACHKVHAQVVLRRIIDRQRGDAGVDGE